MKWISRGVLLGLALTVPPAWAQVKAGPEFRVNAYTTGNQYGAAVSADSGGRFVIAWGSLGQDGSSGGVFAQRFEADGAPRGGEFAVNAYTTGRQLMVFSLALDRRQRIDVAWGGLTPEDGSNSGVSGRRFGPGGPLGPDFAVNTYTTYFQYATGLAAAPSGDFVVTWDSAYPSSPGDSAVYARRFRADGAALGAEFKVHTPAAAARSGSAPAMDGAGAFIVAWASWNQGQDPQGVFGRRFDSAGIPLGAEFRVDAGTGVALQPAVSRASDGRFVITWMEPNPQTQRGEIFARRFDRDGAAQGSAFRVEASTTAHLGYPQVAMAESGAFVVVWESLVDPFSVTVGARRFDRSGSPRGAPFQVNTVPVGLTTSAVASDAVGNFVVAWSANGAPNLDVDAQRFGGLQPAALAVDTVPNSTSDGNGVWEPLEMVDMRPSWRNVNGAAQTVSGTLTFDAPGASPSPSPLPFPYAIIDSQAAYGSVPDRATAPCTDCYVVAQFALPTPAPPHNPAATPSRTLGQRPDGHLDATVWETISPDTQGQHKKWLLHLGETFGDVLRASPYYRFVETLAHNGVTAGCTATTYCPGQSVTREQMAVFVLAADDRDAAPPACGTPRFGDVPASSPFCRWIEELARRGVTGGCSATDYCPGVAVTREQMAVFVLRTFDPNLNPPACTTPLFSDLPASSPFCRWVEELARRGVVAGCAPGLYCPKQPVSREQMAVFLTLTFGLHLYGP